MSHDEYMDLERILADVRELPIRTSAAAIRELFAEASAPLSDDTGLTAERAEGLIADIRADRDAR
jgi:hypothetical protein